MKNPLLVEFVGRDLRTIKTVLAYVIESEDKSYCECGHDKNHVYVLARKMYKKICPNTDLGCWCGEGK